MAPIARRGFDASEVKGTERVIVASGRATIARSEGLGHAIRVELDHLRDVLAACATADIERVVVVGSSDVCGLAPVIDGTTTVAPDSVYAETKAALEEECGLWRRDGLDVTSVRLAPVHGADKPRTQLLVRASRWPVLPLPNGGRHSTGFVLLDDAVRALVWLSTHDAPVVVSVGAGPTPMRDLLAALARAQNRRFRAVPVPVPARSLALAVGRRGPASLRWALRLSSPRSVEMEVPTAITPLPDVAQRLIRAC